MNNIVMIDNRTGEMIRRELPSISVISESIRDGFTPVLYAPECTGWRQWRVNEIHPRFEFRKIGKSICIDGVLYSPECIFSDRRGAEFYIEKNYYCARQYQITL